MVWFLEEHLLYLCSVMFEKALWSEPRNMCPQFRRHFESIGEKINKTKHNFLWNVLFYLSSNNHTTSNWRATEQCKNLRKKHTEKGCTSFLPSTGAVHTGNGLLWSCACVQSRRSLSIVRGCSGHDSRATCVAPGSDAKYWQLFMQSRSTTTIWGLKNVLLDNCRRR